MEPGSQQPHLEGISRRLPPPLPRAVPSTEPHARPGRRHCRSDPWRWPQAHGCTGQMHMGTRCTGAHTCTWIHRGTQLTRMHRGRCTWAHASTWMHRGRCMHMDAHMHTGTCMHTDAHRCTRMHAGRAALVQSSQPPVGMVLGEAVPGLCPWQLLGQQLQPTLSPADMGHGKAQSWGPISLLHPGASQPHNHLDLLSSHQAASSDLAGKTQGDPGRFSITLPTALPHHPSTVLPWPGGSCRAPAPIHHWSRPGSMGLSGHAEAGAASPASHFSG